MNVRQGSAHLAVGATAALALIAVAALVPAQPAPQRPDPAEGARVTTICPSLSLPTASSVVAVAGTGVETAELGDPDRVTAAAGYAQVRGSAADVRVIAPWLGVVGHATGVRSEAGPDRGLAVSGCARPAVQFWFVGTRITAAAQAELTLVNADEVEAEVDLVIRGRAGRLAAPGSRGILVEPRSRRTVALTSVVESVDPVAIEVTTARGRVAAFLRQREWAGTTPTGGDWVPPATVPSSSLVIPGVPAGAGPRTLVIFNPGQHATRVAVDLLSDVGRSGVLGLDSIELPAGVTRAFAIEAALGGSAAALAVTGERPVVTALIADSSADPLLGDPAFLSATSPIATRAIVPVPLTRTAGGVLQVTNAGTAEASVEVEVQDPAGNRRSGATLVVPAGATVSHPLGEVDYPVIGLTTAATGIHAGVVITEVFGPVTGLAVLAVTSPESPGRLMDATPDPLAASRP